MGSLKDALALHLKKIHKLKKKKKLEKDELHKIKKKTKKKTGFKIE